MIVFSLIVIIISLLYVYIHMTEKSRRIDRMFPGPFRIPFIGTLPLNALQRNSKIRKGLAQIYNYRPYRLWFVNKPYIMISDYKTAKIILSQLKFIDKADSYDAFVPLVGRNHFLGTGEAWVKFRRLASNVFHYKALNHYLKIFDKNCDTLCQILTKHANKEAFNIHDYVSLYVLDNLTESFSGEEWHWQTEPDTHVIKAISEATKIIRWRIIIPILGVDWIFNLTPLSRRQREALKFGREYSQKLLQRKKESISRQKLRVENDSEEFVMQDSITYCILSKEFTDEEIETEIASITFAGYDSVSGTVCFALYALAKYQDIQEKVYREIKTVIEESDSWPNINDANKMVYTEQVVCETLRCYSPFAAIGRHIKEDLYLNEHQFIPKNTNVFISISGIHKDSVNWPNPTIFDPDRFSPEKNQSRDPYAFVPFSAGPRKCSGYKFAMVEMKITIAKIVQQYKIFLSDKPEDELKPVRNLGLTVTSGTGFNVKLQPRNER